MGDMNEMQRFLVADHIERLEEDATALRAGRTHPAKAGTGRSAGPRARLGRLLVAIGVAVAGPSRRGMNAASIGDITRGRPPSSLASDSPCGDDPAPLPRAA